MSYCLRSGLVPFAEIAASLGISEESARYIYSQAMRKLKKRLPGAVRLLRLYAESMQAARARSLF